jgi:hypothetical protein
MVSHVLLFILDRYAGILKILAAPLFHVFWFRAETLSPPGLSISRIFTDEGPPVFLRLFHSEVTPAPAGRIVQTAAHLNQYCIPEVILTPGFSVMARFTEWLPIAPTPE